MTSMARVCLQSLLKLLNSLLGVVGMGMILYALWMLRIWYKETGGFWSNPTPPWFIYSFLALGVILCLITCCGHIAAETASGHCLSCYSTFVLLLIVLEGAVTADIFLNGKWEEDFPPDPTGRFDEFKDFVNSNLNICKWVGASVVGIQLPIILFYGDKVVSFLMIFRPPPSDFAHQKKVLAILTSGILRAIGPDNGQHYDSDDDDDYTPVRLPLLVNQSQPVYVAGIPTVNPQASLKGDSWSVRVNQS